jgi:hypothetical protein
MYTLFTLSNKKTNIKGKEMQRNATLLNTGLRSRSYCKKKINFRCLSSSPRNQTASYLEAVVAPMPPVSDICFVYVVV